MDAALAARGRRLSLLANARQAAREGDRLLADKLMQLAGYRAIGGGK